MKEGYLLLHLVKTYDESTVRLVWHLYQFYQNDVLFMDRNATYCASMLTFTIMHRAFVSLEYTWMELQGRLRSNFSSQFAKFSHRMQH